MPAGEARLSECKDGANEQDCQIPLMLRETPDGRSVVEVNDCSQQVNGGNQVGEVIDDRHEVTEARGSNNSNVC